MCVRRQVCMMYMHVYSAPIHAYVCTLACMVHFRNICTLVHMTCIYIYIYIALYPHTYLYVHVYICMPKEPGIIGSRAL